MDLRAATILYSSIGDHQIVNKADYLIYNFCILKTIAILAPPLLLVGLNCVHVCSLFKEIDRSVS